MAPYIKGLQGSQQTWRSSADPWPSTARPPGVGIIALMSCSGWRKSCSSAHTPELGNTCRLWVCRLFKTASIHGVIVIVRSALRSVPILASLLWEEYGRQTPTSAAKHLPRFKVKRRNSLFRATCLLLCASRH